MTSVEPAELPLHLTRLEQLFDSRDPTPFRERDLDPRAEEYIVGWAREQRPGLELRLRLHLDTDAPGSTTLVQEAVSRHFRTCAEATRRDLRQLLRQGRLALGIGVAIVPEVPTGLPPRCSLADLRARRDPDRRSVPEPRSAASKGVRQRSSTF